MYIMFFKQFRYFCFSTMLQPLIIFRSFFTKFFLLNKLLYKMLNFVLCVFFFLNHYAVFMKSLLVY